jgi:hypothetical protein
MADYTYYHQRTFIKHFREAGATDRDHAVPLKSLGERNTTVFREMVERGVFVSLDDGRFFVDERVAEDFLRRASIRYWRKIGIFLLIILGLVFANWWLFHHHR